DIQSAQQPETWTPHQRYEPRNRQRKPKECELDLVAVVSGGTTMAYVTRMDEVLHLQRDEVVPHQPYEVRRRDDGRSQRSVPEPPAAQMTALRWQSSDCHNQRDHQERDRVFRKHAQPEPNTGANPIALVASTQDP